MKRILSVFIMVFVLTTLAGCSHLTDDTIITNVKNNYLSGYTSKTIGNAIQDYFYDCNIDWKVSRAKHDNTHSVEAYMQPKNDEYIKFSPNNVTETIMYIKSIYYIFEYDSINDEIDEFVKVYGTILDNNKLKFFETNSIDESRIFLDRIFGQANAPEGEKYSSKLNELNTLYKKVQNAKTDEEARQIAGKDSSFPLDLDYLNDNDMSKNEIISVLDTVIKTEQEITDKTEHLYD